jgi:ABC-2 type transport system permease protein
MINLIHSEFYKLGKSTGTKICFLLSLVSAFFLIYISHSIAVGNMSADLNGSASGLTEVMIVSLLGSLMAGMLICSDFETKTIHEAIASRNGRRTVVISKAFVYFIEVSLLLLPYAVITLIGFLSGAQFSKPFVASVFIGILANEAGIGVTVAAAFKILLISFVTMLVYAARLSICIPLAFKVRKPVVVMAVGFAFSFLFDVIIGVLDDVSIIHDIISFTPYSRKMLLLPLDAGAGTLFKAAAVSIVFFAAVTAFTYLLFRRDEIK